jgi:translation initiation factor IF-2
MDSGAAHLAKNKGVRVILHTIIVELVDHVKEEMAELLDGGESSGDGGGAADISFSAGGGSAVYGDRWADCARQILRVRRGSRILFEGGIDSLKRQKEDQMEVRFGFECRIKVNGFSAFEVGDTIESFEMVRHRQML